MTELAEVLIPSINASRDQALEMSGTKKFSLNFFVVENAAYSKLHAFLHKSPVRHSIFYLNKIFFICMLFTIFAKSYNAVRARFLGNQIPPKSDQNVVALALHKKLFQLLFKALTFL